METKRNQKTEQNQQRIPSKTIRKQFDPNYKGETGEINNEPSQTVPDQNLSVKQLLINHSRGINSNVHTYEPQYLDTEIPRITDLTDIAEQRELLRDRENVIKQTIKAEREADKADKLQKALDLKEKEKLSKTAPPDTEEAKK